MAAEGKIDPMHQFTVEPLGSAAHRQLRHQLHQQRAVDADRARA